MKQEEVPEAKEGEEAEAKEKVEVVEEVKKPEPEPVEDEGPDVFVHFADYEKSR